MLSLKVLFSGQATPAGIAFRLSFLGFKFDYDSSHPAEVTPTSGQKERKSTFRIRRKNLVIKRESVGRTDKPAKRWKFSPSLIKLIISKLFKLIRRLFGAIHAEEIFIRFIVATDDPMNTAIIYGALQPVVMLSNPHRVIEIGVDFERFSPDYVVRWKFSVRPIIWGWIFFSWAMTLPWLRIWRFYRSASRD